MPLYRVTVRHGRPQQYAIEDVQADTLAEAMRLASERMQVASATDADLAEVRVQARAEDRQYVSG